MRSHRKKISKRFLVRICIVALPVLLGWVTSIVISKLGKIPDTIFRIEFLLNAIIACATTLSGFILTSVSIILGMGDNAAKTFIMKHGGMGEIAWRFTSSIIFSIALILFCIFAGMHVNEKSEINSGSFMFGVMLSVSFLFSFLSTSFYMIWIIAVSGKEKVSHEPAASSPALRG